MALVKKMMVPFNAYSFNTLNRNLTKHLKQVYIAPINRKLRMILNVLN